MHKLVKDGVIELTSCGKVDVDQADIAILSKRIPDQPSKTSRAIALMRIQSRDVDDIPVEELKLIRRELSSPDPLSQVSSKKSTREDRPDAERLLSARVEKYEQQVRLATMKADKQAGKLVEIEVVDRERFAVYRVARGQLLNIPNRVASELAGLTDPASIHARLTEEIRDVLTELSQAIEEMDFSGDEDE